MKNYILIIFLAIIAFSCNSHSKHWDKLSQVKSYIENKPDSALVVLEQINAFELSGKEEKAKYALLYSMALDKNFIDKTDFEVLQPAIDYYKDNGSATDKLCTYYYQGRIYQNMGNDALAMKSYVNAINNGETSDDILTKARLYVAQGNIYFALMEWEKVCEANLKAAEYFHQTDKINSYVNCTLKAISAYTQNGNYQESARYLTECEKYLDYIPQALIANYYSEYFTYLIFIKDTNKIKNIVNKYKSEIPNDILDYGTLSNAYIALGEYQKALETIGMIDNFTDKASEMRYYAILSEIHHKLGNYEDALDAYITFNQLNDSVNLVIFDQDTQFIEERHALELYNIKERDSKNKIILLTILLAVIFISSVVYIRGKLKIRAIQQVHAEQEAERYRLLYEQMEYEKDNLSELLSHNNDLDNIIRGIVAKRIELLNKFFTIYITNNTEISRKVDKELDEILANKKSFMSSTRLAFAGSHPNFIKYLEEHNLSEREIEYCCLYALGLKGKEVGSYIKMRSHFNVSSDVRKKLGLAESDTNLGIYIRKLLMNL